MSTLTIYQWVTSCSAEKIRRALHHKKIAHETVNIDWFERSKLVELSGQTLVPIIKHGDQVIGPRTMKIMDYLEEKFPGPTLYPNDSRALCWMIDEYVESLLVMGCSAFLPAISAMIKEPEKRAAWEKDVVRITGRSTDALVKGYSSLMDQYGVHLRLWDSHFAKRKYFLGDEMSAADHSLYSNYWFQNNNPEWAAMVNSLKLPNLGAWADRMKSFLFTKI